ncbi:MAG TPA: Mur ligase family protein, partial [Armatimonadota bacterium]|nr:Mur ligase family protein [Armatimonadota bacterium]
MRLLLAIWAAKLVAFACRALGRGGGTSLPGLVALRIHPRADSCLAARLPRGCVVITGTNGKTTTAKMVATVLRTAELRVVRNVSGANLRRGAVATLVGATGPLGRLDADIGLFELDEATIPEMVRALRPRIVAVTNLFRDQLDRYGELDTTAKRMNQAFRESLQREQTLVLNADDPLVAELAEGSPARVVRFGIDAPQAAGDADSHAADTKTCPICGGDYDYAA